MQSKNIHYIARLDHLRLLAAATVILFHTFIVTRTTGRPADLFPIPLIQQGHTGVPLFMVISGLILSLIAGDREIAASRFYLNRVLRIYPLFIVIVTFGYFITPDARPTSVGIDYLMALLPISNLYRLQYGAYGGHLWSIAVELQFYLLFPFLLAFKRTYGRRYIIGLIAFLTFLRAATQVTQGTVHQMAFLSLFGGLDLFLLGMLAGDLHRRQTDEPAWWHRGWVAIAAALAVNVVLWGLFKDHRFFHVDYYGLAPAGISASPLWVIWPTLQGLIWGGFVLIYLRSGLQIPFSRLWAALGRYSYSMYVWHILVLFSLQGQLMHLSPYAFGFLVVLPVTAVLSAASYHLIERPFLEMRVRYTRETQRGDRHCASSLPSSDSQP
jgi:peptidoglycan/LPS O-acetylase OafA/YrhL